MSSKEFIPYLGIELRLPLIIHPTHVDPALDQPMQLAREAIGRFWESYWKACCAVQQYKRGNLDQETYQELWEDIVCDWIKILFVESGHFGQQTNLGIEG